MGIASARLAMLPPVKSDLLATVCAAGESLPGARPRGTLHFDVSSPTFDSPVARPSFRPRSSLGVVPLMAYRPSPLMRPTLWLCAEEPQRAVAPIPRS